MSQAKNDDQTDLIRSQSSNVPETNQDPGNAQNTNVDPVQPPAVQPQNVNVSSGCSGEHSGELTVQQPNEESKSVSAGSSVIADKTKKPPRKSKSKPPKTEPPVGDISAEISRKRGRSSRSKPNAQSGLPSKRLKRNEADPMSLAVSEQQSANNNRTRDIEMSNEAQSARSGRDNRQSGLHPDNDIEEMIDTTTYRPSTMRNDGSSFEVQHQIRADIVQTLVDRMLEGVAEPLQEFKDRLQTYIENGLQQEEQSTLDKIKQAWIQKEFMPTFKELVTTFMHQVKTPGDHSLYKLHAIDRIELAIREGGRRVIANEHHYLVQFVIHHFRELNEGEWCQLKIIQQEDDQYANVKLFLLEVFNFWLTTTSRHPNWEFIYFCAQYRLLHDMYRLTFAFRKNSWGSTKNITKQPTSIVRDKDRTIEWDLLFGTYQAYPRVQFHHLKLMLDSWNMWMHEDVLFKIECLEAGYQDAIVTTILTLCSGVNSVYQQLCKISELLLKSPWLSKIVMTMKPADAQDKITIEELTMLLKDLVNLEYAQATSFAAKYYGNIKMACRDIIREADSKKNMHVADDKIVAFIKTQLEAGGPALKNTYEEVQKVAVELMNRAPGGRFKCDDLQSLFVAQLYLNQQKNVLAVIPPGSGKSFINLLLASYINQKDGCKILLLTSTPFLENQLNSMLEDYIDSNHITICHKKTPRSGMNVTVIIDEADDWVAKNALKSTKDGKLDGFYNLRFAKKVYFTTGTLTKFLRQMINIIPEQPEVVPLNFKSKSELSVGTSLVQNLDSHFNPDPDALTEMLIKDLEKAVVKGPAIVFINELENEIVEIIRAKLSNKVTIEYVNDDDTALRVRREYNRSDTGLFILNPQYARGYDLKLTQDAQVFIVTFDKLFPLSTVNQMVGRGSRSFGVSSGQFYSSRLNANQQLFQQLAGAEENFYDGASLLQDFFQVYYHTGLYPQRTILKAYSGDNWKARRKDFEENHFQGYDLVGFIKSAEDARARKSSSKSIDKTQ